MSQTTRYIQSCEQCKHRREQCDGFVPCALCLRRGMPAECRAFATVTRNVLDISSDTDSPSVEQSRSVKRRRIAPQPDATSKPVKVADFSRYLTDSTGTSVLLGTSSTEALLEAVRRIARTKIGECDLTKDGRRDFLFEGRPTELTLETMSVQILGIQRSDSDILVKHYLNFTRGIFDLLSEEEVVTSVRDWHLHGARRMTDSHVLLILAIGARQRGGPGSDCLAESLYQAGHRQAVNNLMSGSNIGTTQEFALISIYLFSVCRRNAAFSNLGVAIRTAYALGLHLDPVDGSGLATSESQRRIRVWKCIRILDVQSSASLGRPLGTANRKGVELSEYIDNAGPTNTASVEDQVHLSGFQLCDIADKILCDVYAGGSLSIESATSMSRYLRQWALNLPGVLINHKGKSAAHLPSQAETVLCQNHMTAAYFWTIILLTRSFLINRVQDNPEEANTRSAKLLPDSTFIDACINSSFRCLDVTVSLLDTPFIGRRLYLVVNTTLVSALVLGLATFGDFDRQYPLDEGIEKAEIFLNFMAAEDPQAARSLEIVRYLRSATWEYRRAREAEELERQGELVNQVFGSVYAPGAGYVRQRMGNNFFEPQ